MTIEQIKNNYIRDKYLASHDLDTWLDFQNFFANRHPEWFELHWEEVMKIYAMECLKLASENATMKVEYPDECYSDSNEYGAKFVNAHDVECGGEYGSIEIEKESITNENNIIK